MMLSGELARSMYVPRERSLLCLKVARAFPYLRSEARAVRERYHGKLKAIRAMRRFVKRNPREVFFAVLGRERDVYL